MKSLAAAALLAALSACSSADHAKQPLRAGRPACHRCGDGQRHAADRGHDDTRDPAGRSAERCGAVAPGRRAAGDGPAGCGRGMLSPGAGGRSALGGRAPRPGPGSNSRWARRRRRKPHSAKRSRWRRTTPRRSTTLASRSICRSATSEAQDAYQVGTGTAARHDGGPGQSWSVAGAIRRDRSGPCHPATAGKRPCRGWPGSTEPRSCAGTGRR